MRRDEEIVKVTVREDDLSITSSPGPRSTPVQESTQSQGSSEPRTLEVLEDEIEEVEPDETRPGSSA